MCFPKKDDSGRQFAFILRIFILQQDILQFLTIFLLPCDIYHTPLVLQVNDSESWGASVQHWNYELCIFGANHKASSLGIEPNGLL